MTARILIATLFLAGAVLHLVAQTRNQPDLSLVLIQKLFDDGKYADCEIESRRVMERHGSSDSIAITAEQFLAFTLVVQGQTNLAINHFVHILQTYPDFELDVALTSPKIMSVFNEAKYKVAVMPKPKEDLQQPPSETATVTIPQPAVSYRTLIFPGWEQVHQNRVTTGTLFAIVGGSSFVSALAFTILKNAAHNDYLDATQSSDIDKKYKRYNSLYKAQIYSIAAFGVTYLISQVDAFVNLPSGIDVRSSANIGNDTGAAISVAFQF